MERNITYNCNQDAVFLLDPAVGRSTTCVTSDKRCPLQEGGIVELSPLLRTVLQHSSDALKQLAQELTI